MVGQSCFVCSVRVGSCLSCMALSASQVYQLSADQLHAECAGRVLSGEGSVRILRSKLVEYLKSAPMDHKRRRRTAECSGKSTCWHV
jgi:hypothetical protein